MTLYLIKKPLISAENLKTYTLKSKYQIALSHDFYITHPMAEFSPREEAEKLFKKYILITNKQNQEETKHHWI